MVRHPVEVVRRGRPDETPQLAATFSRAFADDPLMNWFVGDRARFPAFFAMSLRHLGFPANAVWTTDDGQGVAIWLPPEDAKPGVARQVAMLPGLIATCRGRTPRVLRALTITERHHPAEPAWYLFGLGAANPGRGVGAALLTRLLEHADAAGLPVYLESSNPRNLSFYRRHGFADREPIALPGGPPVVPMWRDAR